LGISHRVIAEHAGIGWRGKNELIITDEFGPALRFTSILINIPLNHSEKTPDNCGDCRACLDSCTILDRKNLVDNYREQCRKYMISLGLKNLVCGKCIRACFEVNLEKFHH